MSEAANGGGPRAAAFFDLDKTLMAGSSGVFFARAAYESGMISRSRLAKDLYETSASGCSAPPTTAPTTFGAAWGR